MIDSIFILLGLFFALMYAFAEAFKKPIIGLVASFFMLLFAYSLFGTGVQFYSQMNTTITTVNATTTSVIEIPTYSSTPILVGGMNINDLFSYIILVIAIYGIVYYTYGMYAKWF